MSAQCVWGFVLLLALLTATAARGATATANPSADAFVSSAQPGNNYGAAGALEVSAAGLPKGEFQSLLRFDLAAIKSGFDATFGAGQWAVQSAALQLTTAAPNNALFYTNAAGSFAIEWMQSDGWVEGTGTPMAATSDGITYNTLAGVLGPGDQSLGTFTFPGGTSGNNTFTLGTTAGLLADITAGGSASLRLFAADASVSYLFNSRNFPTVASRPLFTVTATAVPEPAGCVALLVGVGSLAFHRRRVR